MGKYNKHTSQHEIPYPVKNPPEIKPAEDPENPVMPAEPDIIPEENPFENPPPFEVPSPGEEP